MPYYTYILTNKPYGTLYVGITNNLERRIYEHKEDLGSSFTAKYHINMLVYFEEYNDPNLAIVREKQLKAGSRKKKIKLITSMNPQWKDLMIE